MKTHISSTIIFSLFFLLIGCSEDNENEQGKLVLVDTPKYNASYASIVDQISQEDLTATLQTYEDFGEKQNESLQLAQVQSWIEQTYTDLGYTSINIQEFSGTDRNGGLVTGNNVIVTKKGTKFPDTYIILDAHYDAIFKGTNDNGSGTTILLAIAKLLKDIDTEYSIKFIHFSGEELGLVGSEAYVTDIVKPMELDIRLVFNVDMVGGKKGANNILICEKGINNPGDINDRSTAFTTALATTAQLYSNVKTETGTAEGSDYVPFENNGKVVTGLYEKNGRRNPAYHSDLDLLENMDLEFYTEVTKTTTAAILHFAIAKESSF